MISSSALLSWLSVRSMPLKLSVALRAESLKLVTYSILIRCVGTIWGGYRRRQGRRAEEAAAGRGGRESSAEKGCDKT